MRSQIVVLDYRQEALKVQLGFQNITLNAGEKRRKLLADAVDIQTGSLMVSSGEIDSNMFFCKSFNPASNNIYEVSVENNYVRSCSLIYLLIY